MNIKKNYWKQIFCLMSFMISFCLFSEESIQHQMIQDLDVVKYHFSVKYAPVTWKNQLYGWSLEEAYDKAKSRIIEENPTSLTAYQEILKQFLDSVKDYHVRINFYATEWCYFPINIKKIGEHYYYASFAQSTNELSAADTQFFSLGVHDQNLISRNLAGLSAGDEIIAFNGVPIKKAIEDLIDENFNGNRTETGYELAVRNLFLRKASLGHQVLQGGFTLTTKSYQTNKERVHSLPWLYNAELMPDHYLRDRQFFVFTPNNANDETFLDFANRVLNKNFSVDIAQQLAFKNLAGSIENVALANERNVKTDGREKGFLPPFGQILWESSKNKMLYAYIYQHPLINKKIGYIYLPSFAWVGKDADKYLGEIIDTIKIFNQHVDGLVFDITDNTGGNMMFMYGLLAVLTNKPLKVPFHQELLTPEDVQNMAVLRRSMQAKSPVPPNTGLLTLSGYPLTELVVQEILNYTSKIVDTWESGETFTEPLSLFGIDEVKPHPQVNFKNSPILVLVNSYCLSCGEFFPAILQDNQAAVIFGQQTAGAGGYVKNYQYASRFGVKSFSLTCSISYRLDGMPLENLGVSPDIKYQLTRKDLTNSYVDYLKKVNLEMKKLVS